MKRIELFIVLTMLISAAGCNLESLQYSQDDSQYSGVIEYREDYRIGRALPEIVYTSIANETTRLSNVAQPIMVVAFTDSKTALPQLLEMADDYRHDPVSVTQIYLQGGGKRIHGSNLIALNDNSQIASKKFGDPEPGTVFLANSNRKIVAVENISDLTAIRKLADKLAHLQNERDAETYTN